MQQEIFGVESEYMKVKSLFMNFLCIYQELMLGIKDDSFCATLTITLTLINGFQNVNLKLSYYLNILAIIAGLSESHLSGGNALKTIINV